MIWLAFLIGLVILALLTMRFERADHPYLAAGFVAHQIGALGMLWFYSAYSGDMDGYEVSARNIARLLRDDFGTWAPEVVRLISHQDTRLFLFGMSQVPTTAAAHGWGGVAQFISGGDSLAAACLVVSAFGFLSKALLFAVIRDVLPPSRRALAAYATMLVPSLVFWTCGLVKEAFAMIGLGLLVYGLHRTFSKHRLRMLPIALAGGAIIASVKPYILFPAAIAFVAWVFAARRKRRVTVAQVGVAIAVSFACLVALGQIFPQFGIEKVGDSMTAQRRGSEMSGGGSFVGDAGDEEEVQRSAVGQLAFLPLALVNALLRPFLFEARSGPQLGAALENTTLFLLVLSLVRRHRLRDIRRTMMATPAVLASSVFALTFAAAVGLSSKNLGTLSRYRVPLMPAYVSAVLILRQRLRDDGALPTTEQLPAKAAAVRRPTAARRR